MEHKERRKMMNGKECADKWKMIVSAYKENIRSGDSRPDNTMDRILDVMDVESAHTAFAAVAAVKSYDGRISPRNRNFLAEASIPDECRKWDHSNPMVYAGIDEIHMAHVDNLVTELRKRY